MACEAPCYLCADCGTSSLKAVLFGEGGAVLGTATRRYGYRSPQAGWAEGDPAAWWAAFEASVGDLRQQGHALGALRGIAFTGQMHTGVLLDARGQTLEPTILWLDRRAAAETADLVAALRLPPWQINSTYTLPKLVWLRRHRPEVLGQLRTILWPKDYLRYRLTGDIGTDRTEAGGAALLDWDTGTWAGDRLRWAGLDAQVLPPIRRSAEVVGEPRAEIADRLGIPRKALVVNGMGDVAALIAGAPPAPGRVVASMGSSSMVFAALADDQHPYDAACRLYTYPLDPFRLFGGVSSTTGAALVWAYDALAKSAGASFEDALAAAAALEPGAGGLVFLPYLAGERTPYWSDDIRAGFYGLQLAHDRRHMVRAVLEGIAFSLRHLLDLYEERGVPVHELALAGGGTRTPGLCQVIADVCQRDVAIFAEEETVTRVLYGLCHSALAHADFVASLLATFPEPEIVPCSPGCAVAYRAAYETYRRFSAFAAHEASLLR